MITPAGAPAWTRTAAPDTYGAVPGLHDLGGVGAVNAKTDIAAAEYTRMAADVASAVRAAPLFWLAFQAVVPGMGSPSINVLQCSPMWDLPSGAYEGASPPLGSYPTFAFSGSRILVTFPDLETTIGGALYLRAADEFGVYGNCQIAAAVVSTSGATGVVEAQIVAGVSLSLTYAGAIVNGTYVYLVAQ